MISIIICSKHTMLDSCLQQNISQTIGTVYEIVHINNSAGRYSIFQAYNIGVEKAKGEYLCFMHEDVFFRKKGWGKIIEQTFSCEEVGALGVAGGHVVLNQLDWRFCGFDERFLIQGNTSVEPKSIYYHSTLSSPSETKGLKRVAVIDGVWMCFPKDLFEHIRFDDYNYHDFHLYDSDICMQVNWLGKEVCVTDEIFLEHKSEGSFTRSYQDSLNVFFEKWKSFLPLIKGDISAAEDYNKVLFETQDRYEKRLKHDAIAVEIRKLLQQKQAGMPTRKFTHEEEDVMEQSSFIARKCLIKDKSVSTKEAWKHVLEYLNYSFARHKCKILIKFFWYRIIKSGVK